MSEPVYRYKKYVTTKEGLRDTLQQYGVAIIPNVLTSEECKSMYDGMWSSLERITKKFDIPLNRDDENTWRSFYDLMPLHSMLMQHWQIGHAQFVWDLRQHEGVLDIQKHFWKVKDEKELLVSFDGASFHLPPEVTNKGWLRSWDPHDSWLHTDQSFTRNKFECVQSWATALDVRKGDATLTFLEGSSRFHGKFAKAYSIESKSDWYKLNSNEMDWYLDQGCEKVSIACPAGSVVYWDSRTIHAGQEPIKGRSQSNTRCIVYLCYTPRTLATEATLKKKQKYFEEMRMTNHWPHRISVFSEVPQTYGRTIPEVTELRSPVITSVGRALAGFS